MSKGPQKNPQTIRQMFGSIAGEYDLLNRVLSLSIDQFWRNRLVKKARPGRILDLACGTGDVLFALEKQDHHQLVGADFSRPMLKHARDKSVPADLVQGDGLNLPFSNNSFSTITCAFGVRNFADRPTAFDECVRLLQTGGRFLILEFFPPGQVWYQWPYRIYLKEVLPRVGAWVSGSDRAYDYLRDSVEAFVDREQLQVELQSAGFKNTEFTDFTGGVATLITAERLA